MKKTESPQKNVIMHTKRHWVRLTSACNNHCIFCLDRESQNGAFLPLKDIRKNLAEGRKLGSSRVVLSGGEPTIHPEFLHIVKIAKNLGYEHIQVISNGRMFAYPLFLKEAVNNGVSEITFSMHGHNRKLHERQTRVRGSFRHSLGGLINALKIKNLIVSVDIVINKMNVEYLPEILKFFIDLGVSEFDLLQVIPFGSAWENRGALFYDLKKASRYLNQAFAFSKNPRLRIWTNRFPPEYLEGFEGLIQDPAKLYDEIGGRRKMFEDFLKKNVPLPCRGDRCTYCFLKNFCNDLIELKNKNKIYSFELPLCLKGVEKIENQKITAEYRLEKAKTDIFDFLAFYIKQRYFIKSLRCNKCNYHEKCRGMQCDYIHQYGFKTLVPFNGRGIDEKQKSFEKNIPYKLLRLGLECNANCLFCNVPSESYPLEKMSTENAKREIAHLISADNELRMDISGGEPTLRKDLEELIQYARKKGAKIIQLQTNGILLSDRKYVRDLKSAGLDKAFVALHSSNPGIHEYLVGKKGSFARCIMGIRNLLDQGIEVVLNPVITTKNYKCLPDYIEFIKENFPQIKSMSLSVVQPRGRVKKNKYLVPRYRTISPYVRKALRAAKKYGLIVCNPFCGLPLCIGGWHRYLEHCAEYSENALRPEIKVMQRDSNLGKIKGIMCAECDLNNFCNGVWKEYIELYDFSDLSPVKLKKNLNSYAGKDLQN